MSPPAEIVYDDFTPWLADTQAKLKRLAGCEIRVGVLSGAGGEILRIARVHEYGATITPKTARNLAIPLKRSMRGRSPRDIANTWVLNNGENRFIVRDAGKDRIDFLFLLVPKVTIPERSFIRAGYDHNRDRLMTLITQMVGEVIKGTTTPEQAAERIGTAAVTMIKHYMTTVQPPKSGITLAPAPNKTTPLIQSGRLRDSITYEVTWR